MRVRPHYDEQFKESAIEVLERTKRSLPEVAQDLGVSVWTLRDWYKKQRMAKKKRPASAGRLTQLDYFSPSLPVNVSSDP